MSTDPWAFGIGADSGRMVKKKKKEEEEEKE